MWNNFRGRPLTYQGEFIERFVYGVRKPFETMRCPVTNCELTNNRSRLNQSDMVMVHLRSPIDYLPSVESRKQSQKWVHVIYESPIHCHLCDDPTFEGFFNLTASYIKESDFTSLYWTDSGIYWQYSDQTNKSSLWLLCK